MITPPRITKFINCLLPSKNELVEGDLWLTVPPARSYNHKPLSMGHSSAQTKPSTRRGNILFTFRHKLKARGLPRRLPHLGPSGSTRTAEDGAESLGAHVEGPFLSPERNGIYSSEVLQKASSFADLEACYGAVNLKQARRQGRSQPRPNWTA